MVPFVLSSIAYMGHFERLNQSVFETIEQSKSHPPQYYAALLKCIPIIGLIVFVMGSDDNVTNKNTAQHKNK